MRILQVHTRYREPGGEESVVDAERSMLADNGFDVEQFVLHNDSMAPMSHLKMARTTVWNAAARRSIIQSIRAFRPDVVHVHNTFPLMSPAVISGARDCGAAIVQTLHNYRLVCPSATLFRDGQPCTLCVGRRVPWPAVVHRCYRGSAAASATVATMLVVHRLLKTYAEHVDRLIVLTEFARQQFIAGGLAANKLVVKPNALAFDPGRGTGDGGYALFVGRLSPEKGVVELLDAWRAQRPMVTLRIVGDGPLAEQVRSLARNAGRVEVLGPLPRDQVFQQMQGAAVLLFPSRWFEGAPMTIIESFATGTPVIAIGLGAAREMVEDGVSGALVEPGDYAALVAATVRLTGDLHTLSRMRERARRAYERTHHATTNVHRLSAIYESSRDRRGGRGAKHSGAS